MESKKYFTRYLPVEGEVNQMDKYLDDGLILTATLPSSNYKGMQKVKLFLCSRDIQVGDILHAIDGSGTFTITESTRVGYNGKITYPDGETSNGSILYHQITNWFKQIGEVSPDATWVTADMEFDDDQIHPLDLVIIQRRGKIAKEIRLRCPSSPKHFH